MNNKSNLLGHLKNKGILIKKNQTYYIKSNPFPTFKIEQIFLEKRDNCNILILKSDQNSFEYWIEQDLVIPPWQTHWFQLKDASLLKLKGNLLDILLARAVKKARNLYKLCKALKMSSPTFYIFRKNKVEMISVKKLRRLLDYLGIPYIKINDNIEYTKKGLQISIKNPKFPIDLNSKYGSSLLGALVSDGCIYVDKKARGVIRTKYSTSEKKSIISFINAINQVYGSVYTQKEYVRNCITIRIGSSIIGETLIKVGMILGHKAKVDGHVPWIIRFGPKNLKRYYLRSVFSDEASIYLGSKLYDSYIILSRYKHLNKITAEEQKALCKLEEHMSFRKFPTGHINKSITTKKALALLRNGKAFVKLMNSAPRLLLEESKLLNNFGIKNRLWSRSLNKTHLGNYSLCYDLFINKKDSLIKFYKEIGFSLSVKQEKLIKLIKPPSNEDGIKTL